MIVDVGIACNKNQSHRWWSQVMGELLNVNDRGEHRIGSIITVGSALPDFSKSEIAALGLGRLGLTDVNRSQIVKRHLEEGEEAGAIWWLDDDTVPPAGALERLLGVEADVVAGAYFLRAPPCNPVAYYQNALGFYNPLWNFQKGETVAVDSVGMGCTVVRRYVYERIMREYLLFRRARTGSLLPIHQEDILQVGKVPKLMGGNTGKVLLTPEGEAVHLEGLRGPVDPKSVPRWPFYAMEFERTEDHHFCEMVRRLGMVIVIDTGIECQHWGDTAIIGQNFRDMREWARRNGAEELQEGAPV